MTTGTVWSYRGNRVTPGRTARGVGAFLRRVLGARPAPDRRRTLSSSTIVWAVRRDWPVDGTHEFICPSVDRRAATRQLAKDRTFWRFGPIRPRLSVVRLSAHEFALHGRARRLCRAPDCAVEDVEATV
jgi:hypothetical protein